MLEHVAELLGTPRGMFGAEGEDARLDGLGGETGLTVGRAGFVGQSGFVFGEIAKDPLVAGGPGDVEVAAQGREADFLGPERRR